MEIGRNTEQRVVPWKGMRTTPSAVTFDLWHTLVYLDPDSEDEYMAEQVEVAVRALEGCEPLPGLPRAGPTELRSAFEREFSLAIASAGEGRTVTPVDQFARAAHAGGRVPEPQTYLATLEELVRGTPFLVAPGALSALRELRSLGYRVGVISNTVGEPGRFFRPVLHRLGFDESVQSYLFSDEHPWAKPAPEIFRAALTELGSDPAHSVHIGDGWSDLEGARRSGLRAGVRFTGLGQYGARYRRLNFSGCRGPPVSEHTIADLADVVPTVERLLPIGAQERSRDRG